MIPGITNNKFSVLFIIILITSTYNLKAAKSTVNFPGLFMKNQGQFKNESRYCLKSAKSNTFFFDQFIVHQFVSGNNEQDTANPAILNMRIDFENSNPHPVFEERDPLASRSNFFIGNDPSAWKTDVASFGTLAYNELYDKIDLVYYNSARGIKSDFVIHAGGDYSDITLKYSGVKNISINPQGALLLCTDAGEITEHIPEAYQWIDGIKIPVKATYKLEEGFKVRFEAQDYNPEYDLVIDPQLIYCSYFGGSDDDQFFHGSIVKDSQSNIYFTCKSKSMNFPVTAGSYSNTYSGFYDIVVVKLNPTATQILFSTFIGGNDDDCPYGIALSGPSNDIVVAGFTRGSNFPITPGVYQNSYAGGPCDGFVLKLNNSGSNLIFSTFIGSDKEDYIQDVDIDASSNIYFGGYSSSDFPTITGAYQAANANWGGYDLFVSKLNSTGTTLIASTMIGGSSYDRGYNVAFDNTGNVYISGSVEGSFPTTAGAYDDTFNGGPKDVVVCKFNPGLTSLLYSTYLGGNGEDTPIDGFIVDNLNQVTITGRCGAGFPTTAGAYSQVYAGGTYDVFLTRLNPTFSDLVFSTIIGGSGDDFGNSLSIGNNGNLLITGLASTGFPTTPCTYDNTFNGNGDAFIAKFNASASKLLYSSYLGGSDTDYGSAIWMDGDTATIVGDTKSSDLPVTSNAIDKSFNGGLNDIFLAKLFTSGGNIPVAQFSNSNSSCVDQPVDFSNASLYGSDFKWDFGDGTFSDTDNPSHAYSHTGDYSVKLITSNSCGADTTISTIKINGFLSTDSVSSCNGDSVLINGVYQHTAGNFDETFLTASGCDSIKRTTITFVTSPILVLPDSAEVCYGQSVTFDAGDFQQCNYLWSDGSTERYLTLDTEGIYQIKVSIGSCSSMDSVKVTACDLFLPNVFTPNNDGLNERFKPVYQGTILSYQIYIFNRWGQQLYESNDAYKGWDGTFKGEPCSGGVYFYIIEYSMGAEPLASKQRIKRGVVSILR